MSDTNAVTTAPDSGDAVDPGMYRLAQLIEQETEELMSALPAALARQWTASPVPKPREDTTQRASGGKSDPTSDIVMDQRRLAVRETVIRSEVVLRDALIALRGTRLAMVRAVARYDGEQP